jgi:hypothetical protein
MDDNRYEEMPEKKNVLKAMGGYFKKVFGTFIDGFRYNNMKLAALLVAIPGLVIGFFLVAHAAAVSQMDFTFERYSDMYDTMYQYNLPQMPFDATGIAIFLLMLFGILNVFNALSMSGKKNLGSVVIATVFTVIMIILSAYYIYAAMVYNTFTSTGYFIDTAVNQEGYTDVINDTIIRANENLGEFTNNYLTSIISIIVCDVLSVAGVVLGFINYDRTYEKVDR